MRFVAVFILGLCATLGLAAFLGSLLLQASPTQYARQLLAARRQNALFERQLEVYRRLHEDKSQVISALASGRLTLRDAAEQFRTLHEEAGTPAGPDPCLRSLGEEAWCVQVLTYARHSPCLGRAQSKRIEIWNYLNESFRHTFGHSPQYAS